MDSRVTESNDDTYVAMDQLYMIEQSNKMINFLHINVRSFLKNVTSLCNLLDELQQNNIVVDIIGICETFVNSTNMSQCHISGYTPYHKMRKNRMGGGVSLFVKNEIIVIEELPVNFVEGCHEGIGLVVLKDNIKYTVCELYRPPNCDVKLFNEYFSVM